MSIFSRFYKNSKEETEPDENNEAEPTERDRHREFVDSLKAERYDSDEVAKKDMEKKDSYDADDTEADADDFDNEENMEMEREIGNRKEIDDDDENIR